MRTFNQWLEVYSKDNEYLRHYLKTDFDLTDIDFHSWEGLDAVLDRLGLTREELEDSQGSDEYYAMIDKIQKSLTQRDKDSLTSHAMKYAGDAPTWMHMHGNKRVPRTTWLIHFSDNASRIVDRGFTYGTQDITRLGLTSYVDKKHKEGGGYAFAFVAQNRDALQVSREGKYGKDAVMFQASGIETWHHGDEENQVVFWGPAIKKENLILLTKDDDVWSVMSRDHREIYKSDFRKVVDWVINNYRQYHRKIMKALP